MKKLALLMLLSVTAPLFAVISDAEYAQEVQKLKDKYVSQSGIDPVKAREIIDDLFDDSALQRFAYQGNLPAVQYLIEVKKVSPNQNIQGKLPLTIAVEEAHDEIVKYLLDHGANKEEDIKAAKDAISSQVAMMDPDTSTIPEKYKETLEILEYYTPKSRL